jgi:hypothetical protein
MGRILGWTEFEHRASPPELADPTASFDPAPIFDEIELKLYIRDRERYEAARRAFFEHARHLANRQRLHRMQAHIRRSESRLADAADALIRGADGKAEEAWDEAKAEVEAACREAWAVYGRGPDRAASPAQHSARAGVLLGAASRAQAFGSEVEGERMLVLARAQVDEACKKAWDAYQHASAPRSDEVVTGMLESLQEAQLIGVDSPTVHDMELEVTRLLRAPGRLDFGE